MHICGVYLCYISIVHAYVCVWYIYVVPVCTYMCVSVGHTCGRCMQFVYIVHSCATNGTCMLCVSSVQICGVCMYVDCMYSADPCYMCVGVFLWCRSVLHVCGCVSVVQICVTCV